MDLMNRRDFLKRSGAMALAALPVSQAFAEKPSRLAGKAESCIFIWLGGGACQIDTWDAKRLGDPKKKKAGSAYKSIPSAIPDVKICEHLHRSAPLLDRCAIIRSVHHRVADHAAATNRVHTGRPSSSTVVYPSIGSIIVHEKPPTSDSVPAYVVMGYPNLTRGPGFLGPRYGYVYLTDTKAGPHGLMRPQDVSVSRQRRREALLADLRKSHLRHNPDDRRILDYADAGVRGLKMAGSRFLKTFDLEDEPATLRTSYGSEFGMRCLLARRLVQSGVRFVEVSHNLNFINGTGWDTHNQGQLQQHVLIRELDKAFATLLVDLEKHRILDTTLVVIATEFGRPPEFDGGGGRGHHNGSFTIVLAGGGTRLGRAIGATDDLGKKIVSRPVSVPDLHATIHAALGINWAKNLYNGDRPVPITDNGKPIRELFV